jgi:hypothetical protein
MVNQVLLETLITNKCLTQERKLNMKTLKGTLVYVMLDKPRNCYDEAKGQEWKCGIVVDEDTADAFAEIYPKQAAKKVKIADFEETYKCKPPEGAGKNVYVITLRKNTKLANGEPVPDKYKPRVFQRKGGALVDITATSLPANGSTGEISIDHYDGKMGAVARLKNVLVTDLIEFERSNSASYESGDEFADDGSGDSVKVPAKAVAAASKSKKAVPALDEDDGDSPF